MLKKRRLALTLLLAFVLVAVSLVGCVGDPITDLYTQNIYPGTTDTYDIGSLVLQYQSGYFQNLFLNGVPVGGGAGDVVGTPPSTDNAIARYDGVTGLLIQNSLGVTIDDFNNLTATGDLGGFDINATNDLNCVNDLDVTDDADVGGDLVVDGSLTADDFIDWSAGNVTYVPLTGSIQTYVNNAVAGDTLVLASGKYTITSAITISKQLNIRGQGDAGFATTPVTPSHGTIISCATNNVVAFQVSHDNVRIAHLSINMTGDNSEAISTTSNLVGVVFTNIDVIVDCAGTAQAFTIDSSNAVLRDLTFYVTSSDNTASGVLAYNNGTSTQDAVIDCFNVTGTVQGGATSAYAFGAWNNNDGGHSITLNLSNTIAVAMAGTPIDAAVVSYSVTTNNAIVNAYFCTLDGENWDALQTGTNELNLGGSVLVNNRVSGTVTYRATMAAGGGVFSGVIDMNSNQINEVADPTLAQDAATKNYVDTAIGGSIFKSYIVSTQGLGAGVTIYAGGFYEAAIIDANLTQAGPTVTYGAANRASGAHAFLVASGAGTVDAGTVSIVVSGTSITDAGVRTVADSETIVADITSMSTNDYYETSKKWLGQITYTLTPAGATVYSATFNYGFAKYEDFGNKDFTIRDIEAVGYAGANEGDLDIQLLHHKATGWTYSAAAFVPGAVAIVSLASDYVTDDELDNSYHFAWKRAGLSIAVTGSGSEGLVVRIVTTANNSIQYASIHIGIQYS